MSQKPRIKLRADVATHSKPPAISSKETISQSNQSNPPSPLAENALEQFLGKQLLSTQTRSIGLPLQQRLSGSDNPYYRPKKKQISIRMDKDVLEWFQAQPGKYQQHINYACRAYMLANLQEQPVETPTLTKEPIVT